MKTRGEDNVNDILDLQRAAERFNARVKDLVEVLPRDDLAGQALSIELESAHRRFTESWDAANATRPAGGAPWRDVEQSAHDCLHLIELLWRTQMLHPPRVLQILAHGRAFADAVARSHRTGRAPARRRGGGGR